MTEETQRYAAAYRNEFRGVTDKVLLEVKGCATWQDRTAAERKMLLEHSGPH